MEKKLESKKNELDEVNEKLKGEKRSNKNFDNLAKRHNKERYEIKEKFREEMQDNLQLEKDIEESQVKKDKENSES